MAPSVSSMDSGKTPIEPAEGTPESDEFDFVSDWDKLSIPPRDAGSNVWQHVYEGGRRYHLYKHGRYPIPNDETEQDREDMKHAMMMELCDGSLFYAPIGDFPKKIMDIGTGTGIWAIEVGDLFPDAEILGTDLSPIQPEWVPQNVRFMVDDCEDDWLNGFGWDFVHLRQMSGMVRNIEKVILQSFEHIKPGGWIELQDLHVRVNCDDGSMPIDDPLKRFYTIVFEALAKQGLDCDKPKNLRHTLERAGFVNIQCVRKKVPIGVWAKDPALRIVGHYMKTAILDVIPALAGKPFEDIQVSKVESAVWLAKLRQSLEDTNVHRYFTFFFWFAQKPLP